MISGSCDSYRQYDLRVLDRGGEHTVFCAAGHEGIVLKVHRRVTEMMAERGAADGDGELSAEWQEFAEVYLDTERYRLRRLTAHFGYEQVPRHKKGMLCLAAAWWGQIFGRRIPPPDTACFQALVTVQQKVNGLDDPARLSLAGGYTELLPKVDAAVYHKVTEQFVWGCPQKNPMRVGEFLAVHPAVSELFYKAQADKQLRHCLSEIVSKVIAYSQATDEILDLAARDNLIFWSHNGEWRYCLVDALYPFKPDMLAQSRTIIEQCPTSLSERASNILLNTINFVRLINGWAYFLGMDERIWLTDGKQAIDLLTMLQQGVNDHE